MAAHAAQPNRFVLWTRRVLHLPGGSTDEVSGVHRRSAGPDLADPARITPAVRDAE